MDDLQVQLVFLEKQIFEADGIADWVALMRCMPEENELQNCIYFGHDVKARGGDDSASRSRANDPQYLATYL